MRRVFVVGGAGFIGSHFVDRLLADPSTEQVTIFDNFSSGQDWHFAHHLTDARFTVVKGDVGELEALVRAMSDHELVIHLASNPDIAKAATDPTVDFHEGTLLTHHVVEAVRRSGARTLLYASGSGVYGDLGDLEAPEDHGPLLPISTYGASKLAGEALITSYCHMFGIRASAFRFGNVVGRRQTHGVGFDFLRRLLADATHLTILGDGSQSKSYIHVDDVVRAVLGVGRELHTRPPAALPYRVYNVATGDYVTVAEIADLAIEVMALPTGSVQLRYSGGDRGWKGDVPVVRLNTDRIRATGWRCERTTREALRASMEAMLADLADDRG